METTPTITNIAEIAAALAQFQAEVTDPDADQTAKIEPKDKTKQAFSYPYADLAGVLSHVRPLLSKHGLSVVQDAVCEPDHVAVKTHILHTSGQSLSFGPLRMPADGDAKAWGSAITYARRYALMAALGIAARGSDDDARGAGGRKNKPLTDGQKRKLGYELERGGFTDEEVARALATYQVNSIAELNVAQASDFIEKTIAEADRRTTAKAAGADPVTGEVGPPADDPPEEDDPEFDEGPPGMDAEEYRQSRQQQAPPRDDGTML